MTFSGKIFLFLALIGLSLSVSAQQVSYTPLETEARMPKFRVGLEVLHLDGMFGLPEDITAGIGAYGGINLGKRIGFTGTYYLPVYQSGRTSFQAGGFLAFTSKEVDKKIRVNLKAFGGRTSYINVPIKALKQNRLRYGLAVVSTDQLGSVVDEAQGVNLTDVSYRTRSQMFYAGISRFWGTFAKIDAEGYGEKKSGGNYSIGFDVLIQGATFDSQVEVNGQDFDITRAGEYSPLGMRVFIELENMGGLFPFGMYTRAGWRPGFVGGNNSFLEFGVVFPLIAIK